MLIVSFFVVNDILDGSPLHARINIPTLHSFNRKYFCYHSGGDAYGSLSAQKTRDFPKPRCKRRRCNKLSKLGWSMGILCRPEITNTHMDKVAFCYQNIMLPSMQPPTFWRQLEGTITPLIHIILILISFCFLLWLIVFTSKGKITVWK